MRKKICILVIYTLLTINVFCINQLLNQLSLSAEAYYCFGEKFETILYEEETINIKNEHRNEIIFIITDKSGQILYKTQEEQIEIKDFYKSSKAAHFYIIAIKSDIKTIQELMDKKYENIKQLLEIVESKRCIETNTKTIHYNYTPIKYDTKITLEREIERIYINGEKYNRTEKINFIPGAHYLAYKESEKDRQYEFQVIEQQKEQKFYFPKTQAINIEINSENGECEILKDLDLEIITISYIANDKSIIYKEEKIYSKTIQNNRLEIEVIKAIKYDNLSRIKFSITDNKREIFKKYYSINSIQSLQFLEEKISYNIIFGENENVSIMDSEWFTILKEASQIIPEWTHKAKEYTIDDYMKIKIKSNKEDTKIYLDGQYIGTAPIVLWLLKTEEYQIEAQYLDQIKSFELNQFNMQKDEKEFLFF